MLTNDREFRQQLHNLHVLAHSASTSGAELAGLDFGPIPSQLMGTAPEEKYARHLADMRDRWVAVKLCAGRLPDDPIRAGYHILESIDEVTQELRLDRVALRLIVEDRAPDGGRWFPWAMEHPGEGIEPHEAAQRDMRVGSAEAFLAWVDKVGGFRRRLRLSLYLDWLVRAFSAALVVVLTVALEPILSPFPTIVVATLGYLALDVLVVDRVIKGMLLEKGQRSLLDRAAESFSGDIGMATLAASLARRDGLS
jgi:hypothetical protein